MPAHSFLARVLRDSFFLAVIGGALLVPSAADAHALLVSPVPRDNSDLHKDPNGPCGVAKTSNPTVLTAGSTVTVDWKETVDHQGCFLFDLSTDGDQTWQLVANVKHKTSPPTPRSYTAQVQLPAGVTCTNCTFRMRQIMYGLDTDPCPPATIPPGATYYSCADVTLQGGTPPPDMASPAAVDAASSPPSGTTPSGCQVSRRAPRTLLPLTTVLLPLLFLRRRRRQAT